MSGIDAGPAPILSGVQGLCPRCGAHTLFSGLASFAAACANCGLDFAAFNVGDGPAAFLTLGVGALVTIGAVSLELAVSPPFWVHILIWLPVAALLVVGTLRVAKGWLLALEYRNAAREGRIEQPRP
jgi:uncharacterized protein (DUF983 family)